MRRLRVLPCQLLPGDCWAGADGVWRVIRRPYSRPRGRAVEVTATLVGHPGIARTWVYSPVSKLQIAR